MAGRVLWSLLCGWCRSGVVLSVITDDILVVFRSELRTAGGLMEAVSPGLQSNLRNDA